MIIESPIVLSLMCAAVAVLVVTPGYRSPYMNGPALSAPMPAKFPLKSFARAAMVVFVVLLNAASIVFAHRFPLGTNLIAAGFLLLLFAPADEVQTSD
ncbi:MAG: hypothetical protein WDN45_09720 [Caulobacteraceae bacterium]